jgi:ribosomal protein S18 acetylase RimI-like enzyme
MRIYQYWPYLRREELVLSEMCVVSAISLLSLIVADRNHAARRLYGGFGFVVAGVRRGYYTNPIEDALVLCRDEPVPGRP